ncbi:MAG: UMP kinase [Hyphomicrobiaceae bacterium]
MAGAAPKFKRLLLKLSGEALMGAGSHGIDIATATRFAREIAAARALGTEICLVVGGGNIFRGMAGVANGLPRGTADYMGMLATVMNSLALRGVLEAQGVPARVMSAIPMPTVCESFSADKARHHLAKGRVVIFGGGTGNPFFTTDTTAALRAAEMGCDGIAKATQVDGIYSADPKIDPNAQRFDALTYAEVLQRDLKVMDGAAIALARDNGIPIIVFSIREDGNLVKLLKGEARATIVR